MLLIYRETDSSSRRRTSLNSWLKTGPPLAVIAQRKHAISAARSFSESPNGMRPPRLSLLTNAERRFDLFLEAAAERVRFPLRHVVDPAK